MTKAPVVLIVDDYPDARVLLAYVLEDAGFRVIHASTGPEAIVLAREHHPAAIVMDVNMPGMGGVEATRQIRSQPGLADIAIVANTLAPEQLEAVRDLFDAICAKPSSPETLIELLQHAIRARSGG